MTLPNKTELQNWVNSHAQSRRKNTKLTQFLALRSCIDEFLQSGYTMTDIHSFLHAKGQFDGCFALFSRYVKKYIRKESIQRKKTFPKDQNESDPKPKQACQIDPDSDPIALSKKLQAEGFFDEFKPTTKKTDISELI